MRLAGRLKTILRRRGCPVTEAVKDAVNDLVATIYENNPDRREDQAEGDEITSAEELAQTRSITCPHCGETIAIALDLSGADQDDIQDCEVCCSPIHVVYTVHNGALGSFFTEAG
jgi:hypothetical protein